MRVLVVDKDSNFYGQVLDTVTDDKFYWWGFSDGEEYIFLEYQIKEIPKPIRTAWQWHELYNYIIERGLKKLPKVPYFDIQNQIDNYNTLLQKCKQEMMK